MGVKLWILIKWMLIVTIRFTLPFYVVKLILRAEYNIKKLIYDGFKSIPRVIFGKHYCVSSNIKKVIRQQTKKKELELNETKDKIKRIEIENKYAVETVNEIKKVYESQRFTIEEIGSRLNILNSDVNYFTCIFTGLIASMMFEGGKSIIEQLDKLTTNAVKNSNLIVKISVYSKDLVFFVVITIIGTLFAYYFRRVVVIGLNNNAVFDEAEKKIINEVLKNKYYIEC